MTLFRKIMAGAFIVSLAAAIPSQSPAQRRKRPDFMRHTEAELKAAQKKTKVNAKYIRDGATFRGKLKMEESGAYMNMGDVSIMFSGGRYHFDFESADLKVKHYRTMTKKDQYDAGISDYAYNNTYDHKQMFENFDSSGMYEVVEQYGDVKLILYSGDSKEKTFMTVALDSADAQSFRFESGLHVFDMSFAK